MLRNKKWEKLHNNDQEASPLNSGNVENKEKVHFTNSQTALAINQAENQTVMNK